MNDEHYADLLERLSSNQLIAGFDFRQARCFPLIESRRIKSVSPLFFIIVYNNYTFLQCFFSRNNAIWC